MVLKERRFTAGDPQRLLIAENDRLTSGFNSKFTIRATLTEQDCYVIIFYTYPEQTPFALHFIHLIAMPLNKYLDQCLRNAWWIPPLNKLPFEVVITRLRINLEAPPLTSMIYYQVHARKRQALSSSHFLSPLTDARWKIEWNHYSTLILPIVDARRMDLISNHYIAADMTSHIPTTNQVLVLRRYRFSVLIMTETRIIT